MTLGVILLSFVFNKIIMEKLFRSQSVLPDGVEWLAIGDSHITNAINPEGYNFLANRAHSGERLYYNMEKLKYYLNDPRNNVNVVILGLWSNSLNYDKDWLLYAKDARFRYESYLPLIIYNKSDYSLFYTHENQDLLNETLWGSKYGYISPFVKTTVKNYLTGDFKLKFIGGFLKATNEYDSLILRKATEQSFAVKDSIAIENLEEIIYLCKSRNISLFLYHTPCTKQFHELWREEELVKFDSIVDIYADKKSVWYLDFSRKKLPDSYFNDIHHLNKKGADYMTPILVDTIKTLLNNVE